MGIFLNLISSLFKDGGIANDVVRNRILNKNTPLGVILAVSGGVAFFKLDQAQANYIITLLSGSDITYFDFWVFLLNALAVYVIVQGVMLVLKISQKKLLG